MTSDSWKIRISGLTKRFESRGMQVKALEDISLEVPDGRFYSLVGPSGCGKTTLLRIVGALERHTEGQVLIRQSGTETAGAKDSSPSGSLSPLTSMVFQDQSVFPWMTVRDNIAFGLKARGIPRKVRHAKADEFIRKIGLSGFEQALPHQLSGGMKQRVSVARAFANDPEILLMDEPFGALDEQNRLVLQEELLRIWEETRKTVLFVTHSIDEAILLSDRIVVMSARPGRILEIIDVDLPRPRQVEAVRAHSQFGELFSRIWHLLRQQEEASHLPAAAEGGAG
ncbi:ABC transporter ATP-binding protein [Paenibacillus filicis]|uniref:ABC transporter ATP-binding protein n=1 Tax=Paenibacillus filicis TaxID=669464 RepID=A0ABU9DJ69_9BACL